MDLHRARIEARFRSFASLVALAVSLATVNQATAQTAEKRARISYAAGKMALESGDPATALKQFQEVIGILGPMPELLYFAGEAAFQAKDFEKAQDYSDRALQIEDTAFEKTLEFTKLVELQAKLKLRDSAGTSWEDILASLPTSGHFRTCGKTTVGYFYRHDPPKRNSITLVKWMSSTTRIGCSHLDGYRTVFSKAPAGFHTDLSVFSYSMGTCFRDDGSKWSPTEWTIDPDLPEKALPSEDVPLPRGGAQESLAGQLARIEIGFEKGMCGAWAPTQNVPSPVTR